MHILLCKNVSSCISFIYQMITWPQNVCIFTSRPYSFCIQHFCPCNSPHRDGRLGVTWLLEFLFTPIMPFATIMFRVSNVENPTFSVELEWGRTITSIHLLFSTLYLHYTCKSLIHILNIKFKLIGTNTE